MRNQKAETMEKVQMTGVPETMLQTLYARADYSKRMDIFHHRRSVPTGGNIHMGP